MNRAGVPCELIFVIPALILSGPAIYAAEQYKKLARDAISYIVDGRAE
jgi:hypothetical protein